MSQWHVISLEALAIPAEGWRPDGWRTAGEALWPERWDVEKMEAIRKADPRVWMTNYQCRPVAAGSFWFAPDEIHTYEKVDATTLNVYMLVDPALRKDKRADPTVIGVLGLGADHNVYWLEVFRERVDPNERTDVIFRMHRKWAPIAVGYEEYGLSSDVVTLRARMEHDQYRFNIVELGRAGEWHMVSKEDRIRTLQPLGRDGRLWVPNVEKCDPRQAELIKYFIEREWSLYCGSKSTQYDDVLDMLSRINDPGLRAVYPVLVDYEQPNLHWAGASYLSA
jgi:hypothetical protein